MNYELCQDDYPTSSFLIDRFGLMWRRQSTSTLCVKLPNLWLVFVVMLLHFNFFCTTASRQFLEYIYFIPYLKLKEEIFVVDYDLYTKRSKSVKYFISLFWLWCLFKSNVEVWSQVTETRICNDAITLYNYILHQSLDIHSRMHQI